MEQKLFSEPVPGWKNTHRYMATFCIPSVIKNNHKREWNLVHLLLPVIGKRTLIASCFLIKVITIVSKTNMVKI